MSKLANLLSSLFDRNVDLKTVLDHLHKEDDHKTAMSLCSSLWNKEDRNSGDVQWDPIILWAKPTDCCFNRICENMRNLGCDVLASVGCGSGLFEWLFMKYTGVRVVGYEVNEQWWQHNQSPPKFIDHIYTDETIPDITENHAIFACYFNSRDAFKHYLLHYKGPLMIIVGPTQSERFSQPSPLDFQNDPHWTLQDTHVMPNSDLIAFYKKTIL